MKQKAVVCALSALFSQHYLYAADVQPAQQVELAPVLVTADRNAQTLDKAAPNVSVIGRKTLNQASAQNLDDMVLYEPGVSVPSDNNRRGHAGINIRGIDGNRILMMVDGVRIPESYAGGAPTARFRDAIWSKATRSSRSILSKDLIPRSTAAMRSAAW